MAIGLETAKRDGGMVDQPEGERFLRISDTLAKQLALDARRYADELS